MQWRQLVEILDGELAGNERAAELHVIQGDVDEWLLLADVLGVGAALREIIGLPVGLPNVVELILVEARPHHDAAHLEVLVILLVEVALLPTRLLPEEVDVDATLDALLRLLLLLPRRQQTHPHALLVHTLHSAPPPHLNYSQLQKD
jgi:hypothetical protein